MYSHEIQELLKLKNYLISVQDYIKIIESKQIDHIKYDNGLFYLWTTDNYRFIFKIRRE